MSRAANERAERPGSQRPRPRDWPPGHALAAGVAAVCSAAIAIGVSRHDSGAQNLVGYSVMTLAIVIAAIISRRGLRPGVSLLSRTRPDARWVCFIVGGLALVSLSSDAWVHLFHPAAGDAAINSIGEQVRQHAHDAPSPLTASL